MIAVTTHSRTRGLRYTVPMLVAGKLIERELRHAPGCDRYANVIAGPREFWTLTIWRDPAKMREWMRDGTHGRVMWHQPHWLECYWGMRWRPGPARAGEWEGDVWQWPHVDPPVRSLPEAAAVSGSMPAWMQAAVGRTAQLEERQVAGAAGATYRLRVPPWALPAALRDLRRLRRIASSDRDTFTLSVGLGTGGALYLLATATSPEALERLRGTPEHERFLRRWGDRAWWSTWEPEAEFGHWETRRLRDGQLAAEPVLFDIGLPADASAAHTARRALRTRLASLDPDTADLLTLLTSELVTNSARHAALAPTERIGLQVRRKRDWIRVDVIDRGRQFEPRVPLSKQSDEGAGWGLFLVNRTAERWGIIQRPPDRHVWFELRVQLREHAEPDAPVASMNGS